MLLERIVILMDYKIASEYRDVALRPEHLTAARRSVEAVLSLIESIEGVAEPVFVAHKQRPLSPDPNDDMILDVAINGHADAIVTQNAKHFITAGRQYAIKILSPAELLEALRGREKHG